MTAVRQSPVFLVTGSRALTHDGAAESWARDLIHDAIAALGSRGTVVAGDAPGPDAWAHEEAVQRGVRWSRFQLDGTRCDWHGLRKQCRAWRPEARVPDRDSPAFRKWPLVRNAAMVDAIDRAVIGGRITATALALRAPWATTNGTAHTVGLCKRAGIHVVTHVCPAEYGPG